MIARKLRHMEQHLRDVVASKRPLTTFDLLHMAELLKSIAELAEEMEAHPLPEHRKVVAFRPRGDDPESAA